MSPSATPTPPRVPADRPARPGFLSEMLRLWLEHNQRLLDMRTGPF